MKTFLLDGSSNKISIRGRVSDPTPPSTSKACRVKRHGKEEQTMVRNESLLASSIIPRMEYGPSPRVKSSSQLDIPACGCIVSVGAARPRPSRTAQKHTLKRPRPPRPVPSVTASRRQDPRCRNRPATPAKRSRTALREFFVGELVAPDTQLPQVQPDSTHLVGADPRLHFRATRPPFS